jgi:hypothetical protein
MLLRAVPPRNHSQPRTAYHPESRQRLRCPSASTLPRRAGSRQFTGVFALCWACVVTAHTDHVVGAAALQVQPLHKPAGPVATARVDGLPKGDPLGRQEGQKNGKRPRDAAPISAVERCGRGARAGRGAAEACRRGGGVPGGGGRSRDAKQWQEGGCSGLLAATKSNTIVKGGRGLHCSVHDLLQYAGGGLRRVCGGDTSECMGGSAMRAAAGGNRVGWTRAQAGPRHGRVETGVFMRARVQMERGGERCVGSHGQEAARPRGGAALARVRAPRGHAGRPPNDQWRRPRQEGSARNKSAGVRRRAPAAAAQRGAQGLERRGGWRGRGSRLRSTAA